MGKRIYSYGQMKRDLKRLSLEYPELVRGFRLAGTADGRQIYGIALGNRGADRRIVIQAAMHAREWLNTELVMRMVQQSCRQWRENACWQGVSYRELFERTCFFIVPMANPDGVSISQHGVVGVRGEALRHMVRESGVGSFRYWKANARGVDINRNFSTGFAAHTRREKGSREYAGKRPFSERETRAMVKLVLTVRPQAVVNYHSAGRLIYYREESSLVQTVRELTGYRLSREEGPANGNMGDWLSEIGIDWCTVETFAGRAPIKRSRLKREWKRNRDTLPALALWCEQQLKKSQV